jgi:cell division protein FtsB
MYDKHMPGFPGLKKQWIIIVLIAILFFMVLGLNSRISEFFRLTGQRDEMQLRIQNLESTRVALETEIAYANSNKAVEEWARTYERMVQPGDQVIIPLPPQDFTPETHYLSTPTPQMDEKWQIWWKLLFGE